ncbi:MAG: Tad domain-containing protein [Myxococcota bacterium]|nr:Tad domain-containing protein [Myxococcota bacterium]
MSLHRGHRRGQAALLIALVFFSLIVFMALATNMGILVNDRIRMQNTADLGAYSAAYKEAQVLNQLVAKNREIVDIVDQCRDTITSRPWENDDCDCEARSDAAELYLSNCQTAIDAKADEFIGLAQWSASVGPAVTAGEQTMNTNLPGVLTAGGGIVVGAGSASRNGAYRSQGTSGQPSTIAIYRRAVSSFNYPVLLYCRTAVGCVPSGVVPSVETYQLETWFYKGRDLSSPTQYRPSQQPDVWVLAEARGTPATAYLDIAYSGAGSDGGYFGASSYSGSTDEMVAVAVAKPYGGSVGPSAVSQEQAFGNEPNGPYYDSESSLTARASMIPEYRARLAGFGEWSSSSVPVGAAANLNPRDAYAASSSPHASAAAQLRH